MPRDDSSSDDSTFVFQALQGDHAAFSALFQKYYERIRKHAYQIVLDAHLADDVAQETFIRAASRLSSLRDQHAFSGWLFQISGNISKDKLRSKSSYQEKITQFSNQLRESTESTDSHTRDPDLVHQAISRLDPKQREAVSLVWFENKSHFEASRIAGCAESTISWRLALAKRKLHKLLAP